MDSDGTLDAKFWVMVVGAVIVCCIGAALLFLLLGKAWQQWGGLAALIVACGAIVGVAWLVDRHRIKRYEEAGV